ncbi:MAG: energy transducer TonB [Candidatus Cloacimonetes bacterium]|nr:energy transducer TonB [Candidatus Cloacimonadota bacterium]
MNNKPTDWKDIAQSYYDKAFSLAVLLILFAFLVSPKIDIKAYKAEVKVTEAIEIPPEIREKIKPPESIVLPKVIIDLEDDILNDEDDDEIPILTTIPKTTLDVWEEIEQPKFGTTPKGFIYFDDPPRKLKEAPLIYPKFAKDAGIQGTVLLELEVLTNGKVGAIDVIKSVLPGPGGLDEAAKDYARQLEFVPAKTNNQPVAVWVSFPVNFFLDD